MNRSAGKVGRMYAEPWTCVYEMQIPYQVHIKVIFFCSVDLVWVISSRRRWITIDFVESSGTVNLGTSSLGSKDIHFSNRSISSQANPGTFREPMSSVFINSRIYNFHWLLIISWSLDKTESFRLHSEQIYENNRWKLEWKPWICRSSTKIMSVDH